jgi:S-adenosylmethionine:diacylglycerol 3-amino-3-carboxypropyl transferase
MTTAAAATAWESGRLDKRCGSKQLLFGWTYEDASIEVDAFRAAGRVFCIASAGGTAMQLAPHHDVVAVDINPVQLNYAASRLAGDPPIRGVAERIMAFGRLFASLVGWSSSRLREFLELEDPAEQLVYWHRHLDTSRFRGVFDRLLSRWLLRAIYASEFVDFLPPRFGAVLRGRLERGFARHSNRTNPHARALLLGELSNEPAPPHAHRIRLSHDDAAGYLERAPAESFDGFALSNILDGENRAYAQRLRAAVQRAATRDAIVVMRSFRDPVTALGTNRASDDRAMLWGSVDVRPAADL